MLRLRSIIAQFFLLVVITAPHIQCQNYDGDYRSDYENEGGGEEHSNYNEGESDSPDYSKYYSVDSSAPLIQPKADGGSSGFVNPIEFSGFFGPSNFEFGASNTQEVLKPNAPFAKPGIASTGFVSPHELQSGFSDYKAGVPFGGRDFFEESQKQQQPEANDESNYENKPGPSYISHQIVAPTNKKINKQASETTELNKSTHKYNPYKTVTKDINEDDDGDDEDDKSNYNQDNKQGKSYDYSKLQDYQYPIVKSNIAPQYTPKFEKLQFINKPHNTQYQSQLNPINTQYNPQASAPQKIQTPYEKYSFQPTSGFKPYNPALNNYDKYTTVVPNYEYAPSEYVAKLLKNQECKKINKSVPEKDSDGRIKRQAMNCYICKDAKSGVSYEQCSYGSPPNPKSYYVESETSKKISTPDDGYRYKRYTVDDTKEDPYDYVKSQSQKYYSKPEEFEADYYQPKEYKNEEYRFGPEYFNDDGEEDKSSSEKQSEELVKSGENCKKINKEDGMTCMVCKNKKTGGSYEQCSYSSAPAEKKYAYVKQRKYNSDDENEEEPESTEEKPVRQEKHPKKYGDKKKGEKGRRPDDVEEVEPVSTRRNNGKSKNSRYNKKRDDDEEEDNERNSKIVVDTYDVPKHFEDDNQRNKEIGSEGVDSELYGSPDTGNYEEKPLESPHNDDHYYNKHFPEYTNAESKQDERKANPDKYDYYSDGSKEDVEEVLAAFAKKDRSKCKKAERNGMTCYKCTDDKGLQNEECMYVSESKPQNSYSAYHSQAETEPENEESKLKPEVVSPKRKRQPKKVQELATAENRKVVTSADNPKTLNDANKNTRKPPRQLRRTKNVPQAKPSVEPIVEESQVVETTDKYRVNGTGGAFTDETEPIYSKKFGFTLPKYMLTKSEGEESYDEFVSGKPNTNNKRQ